MDAFHPFISLGLAILVGLLLGLEREQSRPPPELHRPFLGGIRTYPLIALLGAAGTMLRPVFGPWALVTGGVGLGALLVVSYWRDAEQGHTGITSETSALLTFLLGALCLGDEVIPTFTTRAVVVASIAVVATLLLSAKTELRELSTRVSKEDVIATLKFLVVAVVALPVLPNEPLGPYGVLNPFRIGLMVALIAGVGFVGYVAMRLWGSGRGMLAAGAIGGLVSSTAVTLAAAARARQTPSLAAVGALSVVVASSVMFVRLLVVLFVAERALMEATLLGLGAMAAVSLLATGVLFFRKDTEASGPAGEVKLENPFELSSALKFGALFVAVLVVSRWAQATFGASGAYLTGVLAGATDVDAISLSMADLVKRGEIEVHVARTTVILAACSNTAVKGGMALVLGGRAIGVRVVLVFGVVLAAGALAVLLT